MTFRSSTSVRKDGPSGRFYTIDGQDYPSVTHILQVLGKPALIAWAATQERTLVSEAAADLYADVAKLPTPLPRSMYLTTLASRLGKLKAHQKELAKAGEIGTQVHKIVEWNLRRKLGQEPGPEPRITDEAQWAFMAFQDWAASASLKPIFIEQTVYSKAWGYAGTMDLFAEINGEPMVVDFKTGKAIYSEAYLQNVAYQVALSEMGHAKPTGGVIVRLPKVQTDPVFEVAIVPPATELFPTFHAVRQVWQWWYANEQAYRAKRQELA